MKTAWLNQLSVVCRNTDWTGSRISHAGCKCVVELPDNLFMSRLSMKKKLLLSILSLYDLILWVEASYSSHKENYVVYVVNIDSEVRPVQVEPNTESCFLWLIPGMKVVAGINLFLTADGGWRMKHEGLGYCLNVIFLVMQPAAERWVSLFSEMATTHPSSALTYS